MVSPPPDSSNITFDTLTIAQVQQFLQGKWKIEEHCWYSGYSGTDCFEPSKEYLEFVGTDTMRIIKDSEVIVYEIQEWREFEVGADKYFHYLFRPPGVVYVAILRFFDNKLRINASPMGSAEMEQRWSAIREK